MPIERPKANVAMQVTNPGGQICNFMQEVPPDAQILQKKTNASGATWWTNLQLESDCPRSNLHLKCQKLCNLEFVNPNLYQKIFTLCSYFLQKVGKVYTSIV